MLEKLKRRLNLTNNDKDALLQDLIDDAEQFVLSYTGRTALPVPLRGAVCEIAAGSYNLLGLEGLGGQSQGGVSFTIDLLPARMQAQLNMWRVGRVG